MTHHSGYVVIPLLLFVAFFCTSCNNSSNNTTDATLAAKIERGDYLVNAVANCMHCHADRDFTKFGGPTVSGTQGKGGQRKGVFVSNITPTVLGNWTDQEIERAITTGITNVGDTLFFTMPSMSYKYLTKYDVESIVAYLRTLKPIADSVPKRNLNHLPPGRLSSLYHEFYSNDIYQTLEQPQPEEELLKGKYLVTIGGCIACHTNLDLKLLAYKRDSLLAGGLLFNKPGNFKVKSANITPDTTTGIGAWTEEMFLAKFKNYRDREAYDYDPGKHNSEMPWTIFANMTDDDIKSIYKYLRTVKPIKNKVTKWPQ
ncbi:MAG: cytochrome C [Flavobacterium psychrophilum]|nr:MAG: cytochrome C [Flavobacterium psychrophilum]